MVERGRIRFHVDARECDAGGAAWRNEGSCKQLRLHIPVQFGKDSGMLDVSDAEC